MKRFLSAFIALVGLAWGVEMLSATGAVASAPGNPWAVREHDEVPRSEWTRKDVGSKANCTACHIDAEKGYFEDD